MLRRTFVQSITFAASLLGLKQNPPKTKEELVNAFMGPPSTDCLNEGLYLLGRSSGVSGGSGMPSPYGNCLCGYPLDEKGKCTQRLYQKYKIIDANGVPEGWHPLDNDRMMCENCFTVTGRSSVSHNCNDIHNDCDNYCGNCGEHIPVRASHSCSSKSEWQEYYSDCGLTYREQEILRKKSL